MSSFAAFLAVIIPRIRRKSNYSPHRMRRIRPLITAPFSKPAGVDKLDNCPRMPAFAKRTDARNFMDVSSEVEKMPDQQSFLRVFDSVLIGYPANSAHERTGTTFLHAIGSSTATRLGPDVTPRGPGYPPKSHNLMSPFLGRRKSATCLSFRPFCVGFESSDKPRRWIHAA